MVSVVTCTIRDYFIDNVFENYNRQRYNKKELIVVLNKDDMNIDLWYERAENYNNVSIYQIEEGATLGDCLNFATEKSKYDYIAKFDDDDFYGPNYLKDAMKRFDREKDIAIVGKNAYFVYLEDEKKLVYMDFIEDDYADKVAGATLVFKKEVWEQVKFQKENRGEDYFFIKGCLELGYKVYSGSRYNFAVIRRNEKHHTWQESNDYFIREGTPITYAKDFKTVVLK
ncbi:glycosyltransferase [Clostridium formicaceticum]|uniref:Glycosyl transferase family 2 n=1 Tax=Clostridium formicaceticum TaxID=1497 RepID=A0AAC9RMH9_9CLOT|nr:glycosyltransferase family A protein [Clostridium formicaceticum]AOY77823.1 hypothetical protein BJL90_19335 [Clostridium formicaceticum]ARE88434.1 Glycosyl transferase family 2 [Clostridium formicaceticum]